MLVVLQLLSHLLFKDMLEQKVLMLELLEEILAVVAEDLVHLELLQVQDKVVTEEMAHQMIIIQVQVLFMLAVVLVAQELLLELLELEAEELEVPLMVVMEPII